MLKKQYHLIAKYGLTNFLLKKIIKIKFLILVKFFFKSSDKKKWEKLKDKYLGERVFLIGNGPSLNKTPLYLIQDEYIMCFNRFHLMYERLNWKPTFYTIVDNLLLKDVANEFHEIEPYSKYIFLPKIHPVGDKVFKIFNIREKIFWLKHKFFGWGFSSNLPSVYGGGSVIYEGFQILKYLGFKEIILLGVDMNYQIHSTAKSLKKNSNNIISVKNDDPNHFDPRYFGKGKSYHQPEKYIVDNILSSLKFISQKMEKLEIKIYNAGLDSKVDYFQKVPLNNILKKSDSQIHENFQSLVRMKTNYLNIKELKKDSCYVKAVDKNFKPIQNFYCELDEGIKLIKTMINQFLILGPFNNQLFFLKKK